MDIVLEVVDTYLLDYVYAHVLPVPAAPRLNKNVAGNATFSSMRELPTAHSYTYRPATALFTLEPSQWASMSTLPRDNMARQALSLFLIVW